MFANPIWSLLLLLLLVVIYRFVISPRLRVRFAETYTHIDGFWARLWARFIAFMTPIMGALATIASALPDILVQLIPGLDFSGLPQPWPVYCYAAAGILLPIIKSFQVTPDPKAPLEDEP